MDDLISRQAAIGHAISGRTREVEGEKWIRVSEVRESLKTMPSEHPERKRGKWTERKVIEDRKAIEEWQSARCSVCGKYHTTPYMYYFYDFAYCPWCGAKMEADDGKVH